MAHQEKSRGAAHHQPSPHQCAHLNRTQVDVALAEQLLDQLLPVDLPDREKLMNAPHISQLLDRHDGNLREVFMQLYDEIEQWNTK